MARGCIVNEKKLVRKKLHQKEKDRLHYDRDQYGSDVMSLVAREERVYINEFSHELVMDFRALMPEVAHL
jgi:hypothetical protein